jgi:hypothetical protein
MTELKDLQIKAIAFTVKEVVDANFEDLLSWVGLFKSLKKKTQGIWVNKLEEQYKQKLPQGTALPNLYEIGLAYMKWQIFLDLYTNGFEE